MTEPAGAQESQAGDAKGPRLRARSWLIAVVLVALVGGAYWVKTRATPVEVAGGGSQDALMKAGLDALYVRNDPNAAAVEFRKVLAQNPTHYGATYQLATALDRAGKGDEARGYWEKMLPMAEAVKDGATVATARARLGRAGAPPTPPVVGPEALMKAGLDALYKRSDPGAAAIEFRKVLELNPTHYGATYQLATALDRLGKPAEARPLWEKVVRMAEGYNDKDTLATARARLARKP
jgi:tetratricopeptide (TPR) repeat protein